MKLLDQAKAVDQSAKRSIAWLAQQEQFESVRTEFNQKEDDIQRLIAMAPASGVGWEECKQKSAKWLRLESDLRIATNRLCERCPGFVPPSISSLLAELEDRRKTVKADRDRVLFWEKMAIAAVVGVLLLFVLFVVGVFLFSARGSGA
jgi:hypothetical protein